jgi:DNA-directed RNA polymerase subunit omega
MIHPSIDSLLQKNYNRFALCIIVSKRARQLINGVPTLANCNSKNAVTIAINELSENKILFQNSKHRVKKLT